MFMENQPHSKALGLGVAKSTRVSAGRWRSVREGSVSRQCQRGELVRQQGPESRHTGSGILTWGWTHALTVNFPGTGMWANQIPEFFSSPRGLFRVQGGFYSRAPGPNGSPAFPATPLPVHLWKEAVRVRRCGPGRCAGPASGCPTPHIGLHLVMGKLLPIFHL